MEAKGGRAPRSEVRDGIFFDSGSLRNTPDYFGSPLSGRRSGVGDQKTEVGDQRSEIGANTSEQIFLTLNDFEEL